LKFSKIPPHPQTGQNLINAEFMHSWDSLRIVPKSLVNFSTTPYL